MIVDNKGYTKMLEAFNIKAEGIKKSIAISERFEAFTKGKKLTEETAWDFSRLLIKEKQNIIWNYLALMYYCQLIKNNDMYVAFLELIDGGEVSENLYKKVGKELGAAVRDEVFKGTGIAPYGIPTPEKPAYLHPVLKRLEKKVGVKAAREFLSGCLRNLRARDYAGEPGNYRRAGDIDKYLQQKKEGFIKQLEDLRREGRLFFAQEITADVIKLVKKTPEMGAGKREGNVIYETKIPYMAKQYLATTDPVLKRYYSCHCPWAREAIKTGDKNITANLCYCSAGFMKKSWEVIFKQPLKVDVAESVLSGGDQCRFAIHLPEKALAGKR
jgi:hypothetical protein